MTGQSVKSRRPRVICLIRLFTRSVLNRSFIRWNTIRQPKVLKPEFQRADRQLYYVTGGYRVFKDGVTDTQIENLQDKIYNGKATRADITRVTKRLGDDIAGVYGFPIPKQRQTNEQAR